MMNFPSPLKSLLAIAAIFLAVLPASAASELNIYLGDTTGDLQQTLTIHPQSLLSIEHAEEFAPGGLFEKPNLTLTFSEGSFSYRLEDISLYVCPNTNDNPTPADCVTRPKETITAGSFLEVEFVWEGIRYLPPAGLPQTATFLAVAHFVDADDTSFWVSSRFQVVRSSLSTFELVQTETLKINIHAKDTEAVNFISTFLNPTSEGVAQTPVLPINSEWVSKVEFVDASKLHSLAASGDELAAGLPTFSRPTVTGTTVSSVSEEYTFIFPEVSSVIHQPLTLYSNPLPVCGDGIQEIGFESRSSCCYDTGCGLNEYCDLGDPLDPASGVCLNASKIGLQFVDVITPTLSSCTASFTAEVRVRVTNPPSTLAADLTADIVLDGAFYGDVPCTLDGDSYACSVDIQPAVECGAGSYLLEQNSIDLELAYQDGPATAAETRSIIFPAQDVSYDCSCGSGEYCDAVRQECRVANIQVFPLNIPSPLQQFSNGQVIEIPLQVVNPPGDLGSNAFVTFTFGTIVADGIAINGTVSTGVNCNGGAATNYTYTCSVPLTIPNYDPSKTYFVRDNTFSFRAIYTDGTEPVQQDIVADFSDITIPSQFCGNGVVEQGQETRQTCCLDFSPPCDIDGEYCDVNLLSCQPEADISLVVESVLPRDVVDAELTHTVTITAKVLSAPADFSLVDWTYLLSGAIPFGYELDCSITNPNVGEVQCTLSIPPQPNCALPGCPIGPNTLELTISYPNGVAGQRQLALSVPFDTITVIPTFHCGDGIQETELNESVANCCLDFSCSEAFGSDYFCNYDPVLAPNGFCQSQNAIQLVIEKPTSEVSFNNCELSQEVPITARIDNAPGGLVVEDFFATLNGTGETASCAIKERPFTPVNQTQTSSISYDCTLDVPKADTCTQGQTIIYDDNSLSFFISYSNGLGIPQTQTITGDLPTIKTVQSFKTLFDISEDLSRTVQSSVNNMQDIADRYLDLADMCVDLQLIGAFAQIGATIGFSYWAGVERQNVDVADQYEVKAAEFDKQVADFTKQADELSAKATTPEDHEKAANLYDKAITSYEKAEKWDNRAEEHPTEKKVVGFNSQKAKEGAEAGANLGKTLVSGINAYCTSAGDYLDIQIRREAIAVQVATIQGCLDLVQHSMDSGFCGEGREQQCFNDVQQCISQIQQIDQKSREIANIIKGIGTTWEGVNNNLLKTIQDFDPTLFGGTKQQTSFSILYNGNPLNVRNNECACNRKGGYESLYRPTTGREDWIGFRVTPSSRCTFPVVAEKTGDTYFPLCEGPACTNNQRVDNIDQENTPTAITYTLFCYNNQEDFANRRELLERGEETYRRAQEYTVGVSEDDNADGSCKNTGAVVEQFEGNGIMCKSFEVSSVEGPTLQLIVSDPPTRIVQAVVDPVSWASTCQLYKGEAAVGDKPNPPIIYSLSGSPGESNRVQQHLLSSTYGRSARGTVTWTYTCQYPGVGSRTVTQSIDLECLDHGVSCKSSVARYGDTTQPPTTPTTPPGGTTTPQPPVCGNNVIDSGEQCDGTSLNSKTCSTLGLGSGTLACRSDCTGFDLSGCSEKPITDFSAATACGGYDTTTATSFDPVAACTNLGGTCKDVCTTSFARNQYDVYQGKCGDNQAYWKCAVPKPTSSDTPPNDRFV